MHKQQKQTKLFFEKDARNWKIKSDVSKNKLLNTIQERNFYVINQIKKLKINSLIDVGCGTGDLSYDASKIIKKSVGIDFSKNMIKLAKNNFVCFCCLYIFNLFKVICILIYLKSFVSNLGNS